MSGFPNPYFGLPSGGTTGQAISKASDMSKDVEFATPNESKEFIFRLIDLGYYEIIPTDNLIIGMRYWIQNYEAGDDFTSVGGENVSGTDFIATAETPAVWTHGSVLRIYTKEVLLTSPPLVLGKIYKLIINGEDTLDIDKIQVRNVIKYTNLWVNLYGLIDKNTVFFIIKFRVK